MKEIIIKWNKLILFVALIITVASLYTIVQNTYLETDLDEYMPKDHPAFIYSDEAEELFDIRDAIVIAVENKEGIYNTATLQKIKDLTEEISDMDQVDDDDVTSLASADNITASELGLEIEEFFAKVPKTERKMNKLRNSVESNEMIYGRLVSEDGQASLIIAKIDDDVFSEEFYQQILEVSKKYEGDGDVIYVAGQPIIEGTMAALMPEDMKRMIPVVLLVIIVVLILVLRSVVATLHTLLVVVLSSIWTFGVMAAFHIPIYAPTTLIPVMLIAIGVADGIHMFSHFHLFRKANPNADKDTAIKNMIDEMWKPVVMTSITTTVGFLSLLTSDVYPIKYFAVFAALGVMFAMVLSLILLPAATKLIAPKKPKEKKGSRNFFAEQSTAFANLVIKYKWISIIWTIMFTLFFAYGISKVWINSSFLERFPDTDPIVQTDDFVNSKFKGTTSVNVVLEGEEGAFKNPEVLYLAEKMANEAMIEFGDVGGVLSVNDFIKRMNKVLNEDREEYNSIPNDNELIAQYFLLYEMSGDPDRLWEVVDEEFASANYNFQLKSDNSKLVTGVVDYLENYRAKFKELGVELNFAGSGYKGLVFNDLILIGQIKSLILSIVIVIILLSFMFKSVKIGLIGSVPIVITTIISFGVLGWLNIPLETTTALISSIAIGIGIDYAVHFIDRYKINAAKAKSVDEVVSKTMEHSGRAIAFNAVVVISGFLVLLMSVFLPNKALGAVVSLNMFTSFIGTVSIMFVLLYISKKYIKHLK